MQVLTRRVLPKQAKEVRSELKALSDGAGSGGLTARVVSALQRHLRAAGVYQGPVTGSMDLATQQALQAFQAAKKLPATGTLDLPTLRALKSVDLFVKPGFEKNPAKLWQRGSDIRAAEAKLAQLGFLRQSEVDGIFDRDTEKAALRYRKADRQVADGRRSIGAGLYEELSKAARRYLHDPFRRRDLTNARGLRRHASLDRMVERAVKNAGAQGLAAGAHGSVVKWLHSPERPLRPVQRRPGVRPQRVQRQPEGPRALRRLEVALPRPLFLP
ncbi:MAG: peptidoglycan-binding protein [Myxococcales bacterium]|nr:peptidoglycan-binding protein [Myxococcales bacterium]